MCTVLAHVINSDWDGHFANARMASLADVSHPLGFCRHWRLDIRPGLKTSCAKCWKYWSWLVDSRKLDEPCYILINDYLYFSDLKWLIVISELGCPISEWIYSAVKNAGISIWAVSVQRHYSSTISQITGNPKIPRSDRYQWVRMWSSLWFPLCHRLATIRISAVLENIPLGQRNAHCQITQVQADRFLHQRTTLGLQYHGVMIHDRTCGSSRNGQN